jgi:S-adenosylmethionine/arginine decarboxylase-like enzyme
MTEEFWGYHLMLDCGKLKCPQDKMNDVEYLNEFVVEVLRVSDMRAWGAPQFARLTSDDGDFLDSLSGYTIVQLLHTSNMTVHLCDKIGTMYFDLFSCKRYDQDKVIEVVQQFFEPTSIRVTFATRQA